MPICYHYVAHALWTGYFRFCSSPFFWGGGVPVSLPFPICVQRRKISATACGRGEKTKSNNLNNTIITYIYVRVRTSTPFHCIGLLILYPLPPDTDVLLLSVRNPSPSGVVYILSSTQDSSVQHQYINTL